MKVAVYGVSRSGKNYFIQRILKYFQEKNVRLAHVNGSSVLKNLAIKLFGKDFSLLQEKEKVLLRTEFAYRLETEERKNENIVVDGHYSFYDENEKLYEVFTAADRNAYDVFFYLETHPSVILKRMRESLGEKKNEKVTEEQIAVWQNYEISKMSEKLLQVDKELHVIRFEQDAFEYFYDVVAFGKYNSLRAAKAMVDSLQIAEGQETVILTDCDKTLTIEDSTNMACDFQGIDKKRFKEIYAGDRYTNYQAWLANRYMMEKAIFNDTAQCQVCQKIHFADMLLSDLKSKQMCKIYAITAGSTTLWQRLIEQAGLNAEVLTSESNIVSKYVKYFVVKLLKEKGKFVIALGDSLLDSLMLQEAHVGYIVTQKGYRRNIEEFLRKYQTIRQLKYFNFQYEFLDCDLSILPTRILKRNKKIIANINVCKSSSGCEGKKLRRAHYALGVEVAKMIEEDSKESNFAVVILMRSGLAFGIAIADYFDCPVLFYYKNEMEDFLMQIREENLSNRRFILCEGVINTGKSIYSLIEKSGLKEVIIATNVMSEKVKIGKGIPIYASRISEKSFEGTRQKQVENNKGPDTADRLFKLL